MFLRKFLRDDRCVTKYKKGYHILMNRTVEILFGGKASYPRVGPKGS